MFARIHAEREKETDLFKAAQDITTHSPVHRILTCEYVPGVGVNLYGPGDEPGWALALGKASSEAVWPLTPDTGYRRSPYEGSMDYEDVAAVVEFTAGGEAHFRLPPRVSAATLVLTSCALKILKQAKTAGTVHIHKDDWLDEDCDGSREFSCVI